MYRLAGIKDRGKRWGNIEKKKSFLGFGKKFYYMNSSYGNIRKRSFFSTVPKFNTVYDTDMDLDDMYVEEIESVKEQEVSIKDKGTIWIGNIYPMINFILIPISASFFASRHQEIVDRLVKRYDGEEDGISYQLVILNEIQRKKEGGSFFNVEIYKNVPKRLIAPSDLKKIEEKFKTFSTNADIPESGGENDFPSIDIQKQDDFSEIPTEHIQTHDNNSPKEEKLSATISTTTMKEPEAPGEAKIKTESSISVLYKSFLSKAMENEDTTEMEKLNHNFWKKDIVSEFISILSQDFKENPVYSSVLSIQSVKIFKVLGNPWYFEDLHLRYPTRRLAISLIPKTSTPGILDPSIVEDLFHKFRPFGKMNEIILGNYNKETNIRTATIVFKRISSAIAARSCLHRTLLYSRKPFFIDTDKNNNNIQITSKTSSSSSSLPPSPTTPPPPPPPSDGSIRILINYEIVSIINLISNTINKHTRLFALFLVLLLALITYTIFDPIRTFSCKSKIKGITSFKSIKWAQQKATEALQYIGVPSKYLDDKTKTIELVQDQELKLKQYLTKPPGFILYITGAPGTGKSRLVELAKSIQPTNLLYIDFSAMLAKSEEEFIKDFTNAVGFFPAFTWTEWAAILIDALTPGMNKPSTGNKQIKVQKILDTLFTAIQSIHDEGSDIPLLIIEGFNADNKSSQDDFINSLVGWLNGISHCKFARVIFTADTTFDLSGGLSDIIGDNRVDKIILTDVSLQHAVKAVEKEIGEPLTDDIIDAVARLGGRYNDLKTFMFKIQGGQNPEIAINEMIELAVNDIREVLFSSSPRLRQTKMEYSHVQLWRVLSLIAQNGAIDYDDVLFNIFKGDENSLRALIRSKLFCIVPMESGSDLILANSPLYLNAFKKIYSDNYLRPGMDLLTCKSLINDEQMKIDKYEAELAIFKKTEIVSPTIKKRMEYLLSLIDESQNKIEKYDITRKACEAALKKAR